MRTHPRIRRAATPLVLLVAVSTASAQPLHDRIDRDIAAGLKDYARTAAPVAGDAEFLRRASLDLTGRIPTSVAARKFLADPAADKRSKLIDDLLIAPEHSRRMQEYFDVVLMDRRPDVKVPRDAWENFLRASFAANKPYDQLVRDLLSADGADPKTRSAAKFFLDRNFDPTVVTRDISRLFLGRNIQCAQCHDHPLVADYKQDHYFGIQAFFNRAFLFPAVDVPTAVIAEKADGEVTFTSVFDKSKAQKTTAPKVPGLKPIGDPKLEKGKEYKVAPAKDVMPIPAYSRFAKLAAAVTAPDNVAFRRTAANRLWSMMFGRGLVHPLDFDHSDNSPSHPELLTLLADEFAANKYDINWLLREIALSKTYQRSSEIPVGLKRVPADRLLVGPLKPLSPEQLSFSLMQATGWSDAERLALGKGLTEPALHARLAPLAAPFRTMFGTQPGEPEEGFVATLDQTLFLMHGGHVRNLIAARPGSLLDRAAKLADANAAADELFLSVLTRYPTGDERQDVAEAIRPGTNRPAVLAEVVWAMLASAEFRFNH